MNKEYKLIKEYPNSPKLGTIATSTNSAYPYKTSCGHFCYSENQIENYPEFWKLVKYYEILSFYNKDNKLMYLASNRGYYHTNDAINYSDIWSRTLDYCIKYYKIHSVKRLSDNVVFSVDNSTNAGKIKAFEICGEYLMVRTDGGLTLFDSDLCLKKEPILTTYDGVEIFEGEDFYYIGDAGNICLTNCLFKGDEDFSKFKTFAKKENAEKYIRDNQKRYSLNDIKEIVKKLGCFGTTLIEYLENEI